MDIGVRHHPVREAATKFKNDRSAGAHRAKLSDAAAAGTSHSGWESGGASDACVSAWQSRLHQMGKNAEKAADSLSQAMDAYMGTDVSVANALHRQATWLEHT